MPFRRPITLRHSANPYVSSDGFNAFADRVLGQRETGVNGRTVSFSTAGRALYFVIKFSARRFRDAPARWQKKMERENARRQQASG